MPSAAVKPCNQVYKCAESCLQVIVLSHDPGFLKLLWDRVPVADRKTLQLARVGEENTTIAEWDIERAVQARYSADMESLQRYFASAEGDPRNIVQKLRPVLEGHCRNVSAFPDEDSLGEMIGKIRAAGPAHPLAAIHDQPEELNEYARRYHHAPDGNEAIWRRNRPARPSLRATSARRFGLWDASGSPSQ